MKRFNFALGCCRLLRYYGRYRGYVYRDNRNRF